MGYTSSMPASRRDELRDAGRAAGAMATRIAQGVEEVHGAVVERTWRVPGTGRAVHDGIASGVYASVRLGLRAAGAVGGAVASQSAKPGEPALSAGRRSGPVLGAIAGAWGDHLEASGSTLASPMAVRVDGAEVALEREELAWAFPDPQGRLVVMVHGLGETERAFVRGGRTYADDLPGWTGVGVRYVTGARIGTSGARLADLLEGLVAAWPVPVSEVCLVGHSMGGLVSRSACHHGVEAGHAWPALIREVVTLGTPHLGAPLERLAAAGVRALGRLPEARPLADLLIDSRAAGIKDLARGDLLLDDVPEGGVPLLPGATHHLVAATLTRDPDHPVGRVLGDGLVQVPSAHGLEKGELHVVTGADHLALLHHPQVAALLEEVLVTRRALPERTGPRELAA